MSTLPVITARDLKAKSKEIMDAVESGHGFTVSRDGREIGEFIPKRHPRQYVSRDQFIAAFQGAPRLDLDAFRRDQDTAADQELSDPYER